MSTALLQELHREVRRIYIAGSDLAEGDFRLKRLLPQLQQLGERAPVFKRLADLTTAVMAPTEQGAGKPSSAETLQDLGSLLGSVLYTQGATAPEGALQPIEHKRSMMDTAASYRKLSALQEALTTTGAGRYEIVCEAAEQGLFHDLRMLRPAVAALNDPYAELADVIATRVLPQLGEDIVPVLLASFDSSGGKSESRKLQVLAKIDKTTYLELIAEAACSGSDEVRTTAISLLHGEEAYEDKLLEWSRDKKKAIRQAAYHALSGLEREAVLQRLYEGVTGKDAEIAAEAVRDNASLLLMERVVAQLQAKLNELADNELESKKAETWVNKLLPLMSALEGKQSERLQAVYIEALQNTKLHKEPFLLVTRIGAQYLVQYGDRPAMELLIALEKQNAFFLPFAFRISHRHLTPAELYDHYAAPMERTNGDQQQRKAVKQILNLLQEQLISNGYESFEAPWSDAEEPAMMNCTRFATMDDIRNNWDSRWLNWVLAYNEIILVAAFAVPGHHKAELYLRDKLHKNPELRHYAGTILMGLQRVRVTDLSELLMTVLEDGRNRTIYSIQAPVWKMLLQMPFTYRSRLIAVQDKFSYGARKQVEYLIAQMEAKGQEAL